MENLKKSIIIIIRSTIASRIAILSLTLGKSEVEIERKRNTKEKEREEKNVSFTNGLEYKKLKFEAKIESSLCRREK